MGVRSIDARIAALILYYADTCGSSEKEGILIRLPLSREGMANYLGIARETISRKFSQMESGHLIHTINNKSIILLDRAALETMAGISR
jgi:CRP/FNR family transcriptional regulator